MDRSLLKDPWFAVKVRTGAELRIGDSLEKKEFKIFVPTCIEPRPYSDRIKKVRVALFPGYVFSRLGASDKQKLLFTPGVEAVVSTAGVPEPIDEEEIGAIIKVVAATAAAEPWPYLKTGDRVRVMFGSFAGVEGILVRERGKDRLVLSVEKGERSISVEIDRSWVRPV